MYDHRLARVMYQEQIKTPKSKRAGTSNRMPLAIVTMVGRIFSLRDLPKVNRDLGAPRHRFGEETGSR